MPSRQIQSPVDKQHKRHHPHDCSAPDDSLHLFLQLWRVHAPQLHRRRTARGVLAVQPGVRVQEHDDPEALRGRRDVVPRVGVGMHAVLGPMRDRHRHGQRMRGLVRPNLRPVPGRLRMRQRLDADVQRGLARRRVRRQPQLRAGPGRRGGSV